MKTLEAALVYYGRFFVWAVIFIIAGCQGNASFKNVPKYEGPMMALDSVHSFLSDSAVILLMLKAPKEEVFENGDREWKQGLYLEYFDKFGEVVSTFKSDHAYFTKRTNLYKGTGNVVVRNLQSGDELNTEELYWDPNENKFYTDKFVTIRSEDEIHTGEGLTANEDFSYYKILKPAGTFTLEEGSPTPGL
jgi:LPS export ABC transporter protein LptC